MSQDEGRRFQQEPYFRSAVAVRRWDDAAKVPGLAVPGLDHYQPCLELVLVVPQREPTTSSTLDEAGNFVDGVRGS